MSSFPGKIEMVNLHSQHKKLEKELLSAISGVMESSAFIKGREVTEFETELAGYLGTGHVIGCANGTDALQVALMALDLLPGDEVIVPAFTYVATAEVIALLGLVPVMADVEEDTFNLATGPLEKLLTSRTRAIIPVHLFGQSADMEPILEFARKHGLWVIEDNAQSLGACYRFSDGTIRRTGTMGHIGCTSFFPTKNLGCMGDGGAISTNDDDLARRIRMIANHGQEKKYHHRLIGCNSRLDTIQAAILLVKLPHLKEYLEARGEAAAYYLNSLKDFPYGILPPEAQPTLHTYNQFTLRVRDGLRDDFRNWLASEGIPSTVYYPLPLYRQEAFSRYVTGDFSLLVTEKLCSSVLSLPIHTEMTHEELTFIASAVMAYRPS